MAEEVSGDINALGTLCEIVSRTGNAELLAMVEAYKMGEGTLRNLGMSERYILSEEDTKQKIADMRKEKEAREQRQLAFEQSVKSGGKIMENRMSDQG